MRLPIENMKNEIIETVAKNQITIIEGKTACGKSTKIPGYLAEAGYRVLVTQPRILATISLSRSLSRNFGDKVGFHTGLNSNFSSDSQIVFLTEGCELIRQLVGKETLENTVLIIDEIHEWGLSAEFLLPVVKKIINSGSNMKLILMSATIESQKLSSFLYDAPVVKIPSNLYKVSFIQKTAQDLESIIIRSVEQNHNVLVFLPGKKEISNLFHHLAVHFKSYGKSTRILPLHSELSYEDQKLVFQHYYSVPKIILATNIAQTSLTIPDIDVVVDTGLDKSFEMCDGIPTLVTRNISKADCIQRMGRAGRCKPGIYYLCSDFKYENRVEFSTPKILTESLENMLLRLIRFNIDINSLDFFHIPTSKSIEISMELLKNLGAIDEDGKITELGIEMSKLPLGARSARMIIESKRYGIQSDALICAILMEFGSINCSVRTDKAHKYNSDLIYELELFKEVYSNIDASSELHSKIRNGNLFKRISEYIDKILPILGLSEISNDKPNVSKIKKCLLCAYSDQIFIFKKGVGYLNKLSANPCSMYKNSLLFNKRHQYVIGQQMNFYNTDGSIYSRLHFPTAVTSDELFENPEIFKETYSVDNDKIYKHILYNDMEIASNSIGTINELKETEPDSFHEESVYYPKFKQTYISLFYRDLKISSRIAS